MPFYYIEKNTAALSPFGSHRSVPTHATRALSAIGLISFLEIKSKSHHGEIRTQVPMPVVLSTKLPGDRPYCLCRQIAVALRKQPTVGLMREGAVIAFSSAAGGRLVGGPSHKPQRPVQARVSNTTARRERELRWSVDS